MRVDVLTSIEIPCPREAVAAFAYDPDIVTAWYENIRSVTWRVGPPLAVGAQMEFTARFLGRDLTYTYVVREWVPGG